MVQDYYVEGEREKLRGESGALPDTRITHFTLVSQNCGGGSKDRDHKKMLYIPSCVLLLRITLR